MCVYKSIYLLTGDVEWKKGHQLLPILKEGNPSIKWLSEWCTACVCCQGGEGGGEGLRRYVSGTVEISDRATLAYAHNTNAGPKDFWLPWTLRLPVHPCHKAQQPLLS